jgi:hypothetical protein
MMRILTLLLAAALPLAAQAETYQVDLLVFLQGGADNEAPLAPTVPDIGRTFEPTDSKTLLNVGIRMLPEGSGGLAALEHRLQLSGRRYVPVAQLSWIQTDPSESRGPSLHVTGGGTIDTPAGPVHALDGTVTLHGGFYLHVDADLVWTQREMDGSLVSWHLDENRRLRLNETHYLDNARLGVITRVTKKTGTQPQ